MNKRKFIVNIEIPKRSRDIDVWVIKHAIEDYLDSVSGFYYEGIEVVEK